MMDTSQDQPNHIRFSWILEIKEVCKCRRPSTRLVPVEKRGEGSLGKRLMRPFVTTRGSHFLLVLLCFDRRWGFSHTNASHHIIPLPAPAALTLKTDSTSDLQARMGKRPCLWALHSGLGGLQRLGEPREFSAACPRGQRRGGGPWPPAAPGSNGFPVTGSRGRQTPVKR